ncbi:hypothetical protein HY212_04490 [Candidatus Pacearchaeota archaeon]|nr:hypothetical protein [Candidatus Pacearchaeota archaeon]
MNEGRISPERAAEILLEKPNLDEALKSYFIAARDGKLPQYYLKRFKHKRDNFLNDLPAVDVRNLATLSDDGKTFIGDNYKCRGNYIFGLSATFSSAINDGIIADPCITQEVEIFRQHDFRYLHNEFTTREEIDLINNILDLVISHIAEKYYL